MWDYRGQSLTCKHILTIIVGQINLDVTEMILEEERRACALRMYVAIETRCCHFKVRPCVLLDQSMKPENEHVI